MKKIIFLIISAIALAFGGSAYSEGINHHGIDMSELVIIHIQLSELDRQLSKDPNNSELNSSMEQLEKELVVKLRKYNEIIAEINKKRDHALEAIPAAGETSK